VQRAASTADPLFYTVGCDGKAVGVAAYLRIAPEAGSIEVGHINFSPLLQRTPAATEAMFLMMRHAFELGYRRYEWKCDSLNAPSRRAAQRLGLSYEGIFRQALVYKGRNRDSAWYAAIDKEWPALESAFERWLAPENFDTDGKQRVRLSDLTAPILVSRG
jgi:RimJ/RimL family protein N-acetyltransferase